MTPILGSHAIAECPHGKWRDDVPKGPFHGADAVWCQECKDWILFSSSASMIPSLEAPAGLPESGEETE